MIRARRDRERPWIEVFDGSQIGCVVTKHNLTWGVSKHQLESESYRVDTPEKSISQIVKGLLMCLCCRPWFKLKHLKRAKFHLCITTRVPNLQLHLLNFKTGPFLFTIFEAHLNMFWDDDRLCHEVHTDFLHLRQTARTPTWCLEFGEKHYLSLESTLPKYKDQLAQTLPVIQLQPAYLRIRLVFPTYGPPTMSTCLPATFASSIDDIQP